MIQIKAPDPAPRQTCPMSTAPTIRATAPRYTSYPPATAFSPVRETTDFEAALSGLDPARPVSVYVHIPFCERLCWFCACRTQGVRSLTPVTAYVETVLGELALLRRHLPPDLRMGQLHFGGGTPTILPPALIDRLTTALKETFTPADRLQFSVEIDPTLVDREKIEAFARHGMTRASIGVQDFADEVQAAIGRPQPYSVTREAIRMLREAGVGSLNLDLVYGLPHQTARTFGRTLDQVLSLDPDRLALFGYAHVPHVAKRQRLIPEHALPGDTGRTHLFQQARDRFAAARYVSLGIDHFGKPGDSLVTAARSGGLRRNFQGYTDDRCESLIGVGASAISRVGGFFHNATGTADYSKRIGEGRLATHRQHVWTGQDRLRARAIEMLMCDFSIDLASLRRDCGPPEPILSDLESAATLFHDAVTFDGRHFTLRPDHRGKVRLIAQALDQYDHSSATFSRVS